MGRSFSRVRVHLMRYLFLSLVLLSCAGCATSPHAAQNSAKLYGPQCEKQGHQPDTEAWRACVQSAELNAAMATQPDYDQKLLRRLDCIDPRFAC